MHERESDREREDVGARREGEKERRAEKKREESGRERGEID